MPDIPLWLRFILAALAVYRLARMLAFEDGPFDVFVSFRTWVGGYDYGVNGQPVSSLGKLVSCPLCIGVWLSFPAMIYVLWSPGDSAVIVAWFAIAGLQVYLQKISDP